MNELEEITKELGIAHSRAKDWDKTKTEYRKRFFEAAESWYSENSTPASKIIEIEASGLSDAISIAEQRNPGWVALSAVQNEGRYEVRMEENPSFKAFTFVNPNDGMVYQKQIVAGPVMFDDERFEKDHPTLYHVVTHVPEPERQLRPLDELSEEQIAILQDYIYEGKPVVKLAAPRKAKPEELE